ncbi:hypothetical protein ALP05_04961 [Pseudomonas caricapapayae]|uniref:Uncharacterized protein n=1 Tax=Pseudomonas caricapapayae TaxID=46678 RepID=A0A3M6FA69_9PSED|nr:hypothetical protein ALP05_04961 [Pseudomonas caricapapayae]
MSVALIGQKIGRKAFMNMQSFIAAGQKYGACTFRHVIWIATSVGISLTVTLPVRLFAGGALTPCESIRRSSRCGRRPTPGTWPGSRSAWHESS